MMKTLLFFVLTAITYINAAKPGTFVTVESEQVFCSFLPTLPGQSISDSEGSAIAFCTQESQNAQGSIIFPTGFIKTAHFLKTDDYVQITGTMDPSKYHLDPSDGGGQYDTNAPSGAECTGYNNFVNLVEPDNGLYCIRCCKETSNCKVGQSTVGCNSIVPGDYN
jgi:hypothetical protein